MPQHQGVYLGGNLVGGIVADAGQDRELIGSGDEGRGSLGSGSADGVVGVTPNIERRNLGWGDRLMQATSGTIPGECSLHRRGIADYGEMLLDRGLGHAVRLQAGAQPFCVVGEVVRAGGGVEKPRVVGGAPLLLAIRQGERRVEGAGMRAGEDRQGGEAFGVPVGDVPGEAATPIVAGEMESAVGAAERWRRGRASAMRWPMR